MVGIQSTPIDFPTFQEVSNFLNLCWANQLRYDDLPLDLNSEFTYNVTISNGSAFSFQTEIHGVPLLVRASLISQQINAVLNLRELIVGFSYFTVIFGGDPLLFLTQRCSLHRITQQVFPWERVYSASAIYSKIGGEPHPT
jgi:hypothetical protein